MVSPVWINCAVTVYNNSATVYIIFSNSNPSNFASSPDTPSWLASSRLNHLHPTRQKGCLACLRMDALCQTSANFLWRVHTSKCGVTSAFPAWILLWRLWEEPCLRTCATSGSDELPEALWAELRWAELPWQGLMFQVPLPWGRSPWRNPSKQQHTSFFCKENLVTAPLWVRRSPWLLPLLHLALQTIYILQMHDVCLCIFVLQTQVSTEFLSDAENCQCHFLFLFSLLM